MATSVVDISWPVGLSMGNLWMPPRLVLSDDSQTSVTSARFTPTLKSLKSLIHCCDIFVDGSCGA